MLFPRRECKRTRRYPPDDHRVLKFLRVTANLKSSLTQPLLQNRPLFQIICPGSLWARDNMWLLSRVQRLARPARGTEAFLSRLETPTGTKGGPFIPVGGSNQDKTPWPSYPFSSPPARAIQLTCSCCSWFGREEFLLIFFTTFVSIHRR